MKTVPDLGQMLTAHARLSPQRIKGLENRVGFQDWMVAMQGSNRRPSRLGGFELRDSLIVESSRDARLAIRLGFSQVARLELREPVKSVAGDVGIKSWTLPSPTPSIRAAPTRRRSFAAAYPRPDLRPRPALF